VPELPEVETVRRRLAPILTGRSVVAARITDPRLTAPRSPGDVAESLVGRRITTLGRRGKYLLVEFHDAATLVIHLRMTGVVYAASEPLSPPHERARIDLDAGVTVVYTDQRRFGTWQLFDDPPTRDVYLAKRLGVEPLDALFGAATLRRGFVDRRAPVKALLLDQRVVAGVGNIYADEALFRARIHPSTPAGTLPVAACRRLADALREVLLVAIDAQGASIRDFRTPTGGYGSMQERFMVFDRAGQACPRCGATIVKCRIAQRGTHLCPRCQRRRGVAC
jgi:formamidopyrimidine-DNA glycosylase